MANPSLPTIIIDPNVEVNIILRNIFYSLKGLYQTAKQLQEAAKQKGYNFHIDKVKEFLHKQIIWQRFSPRPKYIPRASYNKITIPNLAHQADLLYLTHDKVGKYIYKYCLCVCDVASRFKAAVPLYDRTSDHVAKAFEKIYGDKNCPIVWPKVLHIDDGSEFKGHVIDLMKRKKVRIRVGKTKRSQCIVERFNKTLARKLYRIQDVNDLVNKLESDKKWVQNLPIIINELNNTVSRLIKMKPWDAIKLDNVYALPSKPARRPVGSKEPRLPYMIPVRYLLEDGELEGGRRRATDPNWSEKIYYVKYSQVSKNQPVLYRLKKIPHRFFVREELLVVPEDSEYPPKYLA
jgi:hypothetical protein